MRVAIYGQSRKGQAIGSVLGREGYHTTFDVATPSKTDTLLSGSGLWIPCLDNRDAYPGAESLLPSVFSQIIIIFDLL